jgi:3-oxoacyl-[acyl-carrier-protein] synthase-3
MPRYAQLVATGSYLPEREISNDLLRERFREPADLVDKLEASTGIRRRWWAPDDWAASDLAVRAARQALAAAGRHPGDVDLIVLGTDSPDYLTPATSVVVQEKLGAKNAGTFDVGCACASFPTGFAAAAGLIAANPSLKTVLVIGVYMMHKLADPADPMTFFYGDGAGAAVLASGDRPGFLNAAFQADGAYADYWGIFSGATRAAAPVTATRASDARNLFQGLIEMDVSLVSLLSRAPISPRRGREDMHGPPFRRDPEALRRGNSLAGREPVGRRAPDPGVRALRLPAPEPDRATEGGRLFL